MMAQEMIQLVCEPCQICGKKIPLSVNRSELETQNAQITGLNTVIDPHGQTHETQPHYRILYVDYPHFNVRSITTVLIIAKVGNLE